MGLRITAGEFKGRKIRVNARTLDDLMRPTSAKVRESIFNILGERIKVAVFVDLYAGTGAVGFEAMSRGADKVFFVEAEKRRAARLEELLSGCGCRARAEVVSGDAGKFIKTTKEKFDIVFLDPPYYSEDMDKILPLLSDGSDGSILKDDAIVIAEHLSKKTLPDESGMLKKKKEYKYGDTMLTLYKVTP